MEILGSYNWNGIINLFGMLKVSLQPTGYFAVLVSLYCVKRYSKRKIGLRHFNTQRFNFKVSASAMPNEVDRESVQKESGFLNGS